MKIKIVDVLPRHNTRSEKTIKHFMKHGVNDKIIVCYSKELDKCVILNGHHRFAALKKVGKRMVDVKIERVQKSTVFDKYGRPQVI